MKKKLLKVLKDLSFEDDGKHYFGAISFSWYSFFDYIAEQLNCNKGLAKITFRKLIIEKKIKHIDNEVFQIL